MVTLHYAADRDGVIVKHIKVLRKELNLTQEQFGEIFGLAGNTITGYEKSSRYPDIDVLKNMAKYFNVSVDYLLDITEMREPPGTIVGVTTDEADILRALANVPENCREALKVLIFQYSKTDKH